MADVVEHGIRRRSGAHVVSDVLRERIVSGQLEPGTRLFEPELARTLKVSRTPVREALRTLTAEGLLTQLPTGGVAVAALDVDQLDDVYQVRAALEGLVARQACERMTSQTIQELRKLLDLMDRLHDVISEVLRLGTAFHHMLEEAADNATCSALLRQMRSQVDRYRSISTQEHGRPAAAIEEHRAVFLAVESGDPDAAERAMRAHILAGAKALAGAGRSAVDTEPRTDHGGLTG